MGFGDILGVVILFFGFIDGVIVNGIIIIEEI